MKFYYSPGACSLSPHIVIKELGIEVDLVKVDLSKKITENGEDFYLINPKGQVPTIKLDSGEILTEGVAIVQFLADTAKNDAMKSPLGSIERARLQEVLNFITTSIHKTFGYIFAYSNIEDVKNVAIAQLEKAYGFIDDKLSDGRDFILGDNFSQADAYLFTTTRWTKPTGIGLDKWPNLKKYAQRIASRPSVVAAMKEEGIE